MHTNLAIRYIREYCQNKGVEIDIYENTINNSILSIVRDIYEMKPEIAGFSVYIWNVEYVFKIISELKKIAPKIEIYLGGPEVAYNAEEILANNLSSKMERLIMKGFFSPLGMSMFSLLAFYIGYAAYRTFRVQSREALAMMIVALLMILGQIPQGVSYISTDLPELRFWLLENLSNPAFRAIYFSSAIAGLGLAVRMWFSMEKSPF